MMDLDTIERIAASKHLVNIAFLLFIFVLAGTVRKLWRRIEYLHNRIAALLDARNRTQEALLRKIYERHNQGNQEGIIDPQTEETPKGD